METPIHPTEQLQPEYYHPVSSTMASEISKLRRHGYLFGQKLTNSWSPFLHGVIYEQLGLSWGQVRLDSNDIETFLKLAHHPDFYGTMDQCSHFPFLFARTIADFLF